MSRTLLGAGADSVKERCNTQNKESAKRHKVALTDHTKTLSPSKSVAGSARGSKYRRNNANATKTDLIMGLTPSPGQYDNFKAFEDRSKLRSYTIGQKFKPLKTQTQPGPANYDTRGVKYATQGGTGTNTGQ